MALVTAELQLELSKMYNDSNRHYHSLTHVKALLGLLEQHRHRLADPDAVEAAIWFHDCIYDTRAKDNEHESAALAVARLSSFVEPQRVSRIRDMIEATATHIVPEFQDPQARADASMFLDMDLCILGADEAEFDAYEAAVRQEYAWADDEAWRKGRAGVLEAFLQRPRIFYSEVFYIVYEDKARRNMTRSLQALQRTGS